jgi:DNA polymerase (family 10)
MPSFTDHSHSAHYAGGLSVEEIAEQHAEIDRLNKGYGNQFRIFKSIESDILADGSLDYPEKVLLRFDFVVASVHGRFGLSRKDQTKRILRAVENPHTTVLGHQQHARVNCETLPEKLPGQYMPLDL